MHNTFFAERLLARFTERQRAAAIIGDLEETSIHKSKGWFWRSFLSVLISLAWRSVAGYLVSAFGGGYLLFRFSSMFYDSTELHPPDMMQQVWGSTLAVIVGLLAIIALYAAFRFGIGDILTKLAAAYAVLGAIAVCFWWQTAVPSLAFVVAALALIIVMFARSGRQGIAAIGLMTCFQLILWPTGLTLILTCAKHLQFSWFALKVLLGVSYLLIIWLVCRVCDWTHRVMLERCVVTAGPVLP
jgi:hypothetical protein